MLCLLPMMGYSHDMYILHTSGERNPGDESDSLTHTHVNGLGVELELCDTTLSLHITILYMGMTIYYTLDIAITWATI